MMSGLGIGRVKEIAFDDDGGVLVTAEIRKTVRLKSDSQPMVTRAIG